MAQRRSLWRSRPRPEAADPPGADDDPYVLYLRWVEAGRPSPDDSEQGAGPPVGRAPDDLAIDDEVPDEAADSTPAAVTPAATPSTGHVNAIDASTGVISSMQRRFRLFGRR